MQMHGRLRPLDLGPLHLRSNEPAFELGGVIRHVAGRREPEFTHQKARADLGDQLTEGVGVLGLAAVEANPLLRPMTQFVEARFVKRLGRLELMAVRHLDVVLA